MKIFIPAMLMLTVFYCSVFTDENAEQNVKPTTDLTKEKVAEQKVEEVVEQAVSKPAGKILIATWNVNDMLTLSAVDKRKDNLKLFAKTVKPDVLCIQEIVSYDILKSIADAMGFSNYDIACSDFFQSDGRCLLQMQIVISCFINC